LQQQTVCGHLVPAYAEQVAVLSQRKPRDAAVNFDRPTYRILQLVDTIVDNGTFMYDAGASGAKAP